jgi:RNA polymerase sigma factor (TIGR02999 family)
MDGRDRTIEADRDKTDSGRGQSLRPPETRVIQSPSMRGQDDADREPGPPPGEITRLLSAAREGDREALDHVFARVYDEVRRIARRQLRRAGRPDSLSTMAVVHEAYLKLAGGRRVPWEDRSHFFNVAARAMRQVLVDHARSRRAGKRGAGERPFLLDSVDAPVETRASDILELDEALGRLAARSERLGRVVDLRFFAGLSVEETAEVLGVTDRTVKRDWRIARAFLFRELAGGEGGKSE